MLPKGNTSFEHRYLNGYCDALAVALSEYHNSPVHALYPVHVLKDGTKTVGRDFLHAYACVDGLPVDARGFRAQTEIEKDFINFLNVLMKPEDEKMVFELHTFSDASDFLSSAGTNPEHIVDALDDAVSFLKLDASLAVGTKKRLQELKNWYGETDDPSFFL